MSEALDTFWPLIRNVAICLMTTRDANALRSRPMMADIDETTHEFRFLTRLSSHKTDELAANPEVNLAFADPPAGHFVSVSGQAYLTQDPTLIAELWTAEAVTYLRCGADDPDVAVIRVVPSTAERWDGSVFGGSWTVFKPRHVEGASPQRRAALA
jgi:general stress protein 26